MEYFKFFTIIIRNKYILFYVKCDAPMCAVSGNSRQLVSPVAPRQSLSGDCWTQIFGNYINCVNQFPDKLCLGAIGKTFSAIPVYCAYGRGWQLWKICVLIFYSKI